MLPYICYTKANNMKTITTYRIADIRMDVFAKGDTFLDSLEIELHVNGRACSASLVNLSDGFDLGDINFPSDEDTMMMFLSDFPSRTSVEFNTICAAAWKDNFKS